MGRRIKAKSLFENPLAVNKAPAPWQSVRTAPAAMPGHQAGQSSRTDPVPLKHSASHSQPIALAMETPQRRSGHRGTRTREA